MALINCPECGKEISDKAKKCIGCGYNLKKHLKAFKRKQKKTEQKTAKVPKRVLFIIVLILVLIGTGIGGLKFYGWYLNKLVPNVVEMTEKQAQDLLQEKGINLEIVYEFTESVEKGIVYGQSIPEGTFYDSNEPILLSVSSGRIYEVPDLYGKKIDDVLDVLENIPYELIYEYSINQEKGTIISLSEKVGDKLTEETVLQVRVSQGIYTIIPSLIGKSEVEAQDILKNLGVKVEIVREVSPKYEKGIVFDYEPRKIGDISSSTVELHVSSGKGVYIYNLIGYTEEDIKKYNYNEIKKYVYTDIEKKVKPSDEEYKGVVVYQNIQGLVSAEHAKELEVKIIKPAITILNVDWSINSVGGVDTYISFKNNSDKQIAYVSFEMKYYDRMGNPAECRIRDSSVASLQYTGPLDAGKTKGNNSYWDAVIYDNTVAVLQPLSAEIEFTDGTTQNLTYDGTYWYSKAFYGGKLND